MCGEVRSASVDTENINKVGWGFLVGVGYDWRVADNISISPVRNYYYGKPGDIDFEGVRAFSGFSQNVIDFAVGVTFH